MKTAFDVAIVGAGPAGASAAILLARAGWSVALIERQAFPRRKVCGECIAASNLALLDALGVAAAFEAHAGAELRRVALMRGAETIVAALPPGQGRHRWGRALGRERLDTVLADTAEQAGATRLQPCALQSISGGPGRFLVRVRREAGLADDAELELAAALVIGAHGSWEPLPWERAEQRKTRAPSDLFAFKANFRAAAIDADLLPVLSFDGGYGGMVVADDGLATLAGCIRADRLHALRATQPRVPRRRRVRDDAAQRMRRGGGCARARDARRRRGSRAGRSGPAFASMPTAPPFASAMPRARRIRSSAKGSAWLCSRRSCSRR